MATLLPLFIVLLCGSLTYAQEVVRNFQVANKNSTHITFSWDIVDGYYNSSYIDYFLIHYRARFLCGSGIYIHYFTAGLFNRNSLFQYTTAMTGFHCYGQNVMWVQVSRRRLTPADSYSEPIYVEVGQEIAIELSIQLQHSQTCLDFTAQSTSTYSAVQNEVSWVVQRYCGLCTRYINLNNGYFICAAGDYITFRTNLISTGALDPEALKSALTTWLYGKDTNKTFIIYGMQYSVEPGPCGVTIPHLYAPECSAAKARGTTASPTDAAFSSTVTTSTQDNTGVIVASVFAAMFFILSLGLIGYILAARRSQTTHSTGGKMAMEMTIPSNAPPRAATRREQPINTCAKQGCKLEPHCYTDDPDQVYTEMNNI